MWIDYSCVQYSWIIYVAQCNSKGSYKEGGKKVRIREEHVMIEAGWSSMVRNQDTQQPLSTGRAPKYILCSILQKTLGSANTLIYAPYDPFQTSELQPVR